MTRTFQTMPLSECNRYVGRRIKRMRMAAKISQQSIADRIGVNRSQLSKLENSERHFTLIWLVQISRALGCSVVDLIDDAEPVEDFCPKIPLRSPSPSDQKAA